ncbi:hypothetical protein CDL15_Pgr028028 [Punica granatum]|nr:hypothetical protein CDL15_Pgr028028 [Punica granatum]PKI51582.1 hypothetical protein CRG98_028006 [Punica granatum]
MEKTAEQMQRREADLSKTLIWDCGSSLYDSFELESLKRQLDAAVSSRSSSMTHLPSRCSGARLAQPTANRASKRISQPLQKFIQSLFKSPRATKPRPKDPSDGFCFYQSGPLLAIPKASGVDHGGLSPDISLFVRTASERLSSTSIGYIS